MVSQVSQSFWGGLEIRSITGYGNSLPSGGSYACLPPLQFKKEKYWRCDEERRMMFSRKVFCGATSPRRPPGMPRECRASAACASRVRHVCVTCTSRARPPRQHARATHSATSARSLHSPRSSTLRPSYWRRYNLIYTTLFQLDYINWICCAAIIFAV